MRSVFHRRTGRAYRRDYEAQQRQREPRPAQHAAYRQPESAGDERDDAERDQLQRDGVTDTDEQAGRRGGMSPPPLRRGQGETRD